MLMDDVDALRQQAQQSRADFLQAVSALRRRFTLPSVADAVISVVREKRRPSGRAGRLARLMLAATAVFFAGSGLKTSPRGQDRRRSSRLNKT